MRNNIGGGTASAVVEAKSVDVNGEPVSVIFDGITAIVNGEVVVLKKGVSSDKTNYVVNEHQVIATVEGCDE